MNNQSFFVSVFETIRKTFNYKGTANRVEFVYYRILIYSYCFLLISLILFFSDKNEVTLDILFLDSIAGGTLIGCFIISFIILLMAQISLTVRRCRDVWGSKGVYIVALSLFIPPIITEVFYLFLCIKRGKQ